MPNPDYQERELLQKIENLRQEVDRLKQTNCDLQIALETITAHGDMVEAELQQSNQRLEIEIAERRRAEVALQSILKTVSRDKADLEIILQLTTEHGDSIEEVLHNEVIEAKSIATIDGLTQIGNRRRLDEYLAQTWAEMARHKDSLAFILCDVDYFKLYNDHYGHQAGDECLRQIAQVLSTSLRRPTDLAARYGGEEFAIILPRTNAQGAVFLCEQIQAAIAKLKVPHEQSLVSKYITLSMGISATVPIATATAESFIATADQALYQAKRQSRNCYVFKSYNAFTTFKTNI